MFHQSMSRNQRAKGSKVKNILQITVLLGVVIWLLYQSTHSYERKSDYGETDYKKIIKDGMELNFGRKANPGSEHGIDIEDHLEGTTEMEVTGVDQDAFDHNTVDKAEEVKEERVESQEDTANSGMEDDQQEHHENLVDNDDSHVAGEVNADGMQEGLRLPSQKDGDIVDQNAMHSEENELPKNDAIASDGTNNNNEDSVTFDESTLTTTSRTENVDHSENALSDDQSNKDNSEDKDTHKVETIDAEEGTQSDSETVTNNTTEEATTNLREDTEVVPNSTEENNVVVPVNNETPQERVNAQVASDPQAETASNSYIENNVVMPDSNGVPGGEESGLQLDKISEDQSNGNNSTEALTVDANSEGENANLQSSSEEKAIVMSDNNGVPKDEEVQAQTDHVSKGDQAKTGTNSVDGQANAGNNNEAAEKEAGVSAGANASAAEVTASNNEGISQGSSDSNVENASKTENSDHVAAHSTQNNEQNTTENVKDATTELESKDATTADPGNGSESTAANKIVEEGQEGSKGSQSSNSASK